MVRQRETKAEPTTYTDRSSAGAFGKPHSIGTGMRKHRWLREQGDAQAFAAISRDAEAGEPIAEGGAQASVDARRIARMDGHLRRTGPRKRQVSRRIVPKSRPGNSVSAQAEYEPKDRS